MAKKKKASRRKKQAAASVGLSPAETRTGTAAVDELATLVEQDGGAVLGAYRDPFGGKPLLIVSLPVDRVEPTPYQRDPSDPHVKRLMTVIETLDRFLDPLIVVRHDGRYWTPNGNHRLQAMRRLGAKAVVALLIPEADVAYQILALNTEKHITCARSRWKPSAWRARLRTNGASPRRHLRFNSSTPGISPSVQRTSHARA